MSGQPYQVIVTLELPESPVNMELGMSQTMVCLESFFTLLLGMFMVNLSFYSSAGRMVSSSARPVSNIIVVQQ